MCQPTCNQCQAPIDTNGEYANDGVFTCADCAWPTKRNLEESAIKALQEMPEQGPLTEHTGGRPNRLWERIAQLSGETTLTPYKTWGKLCKLCKNWHPMLECVKMYDEGRVLPVAVVRLRNMVDQTQGFTDDTTYGPTYPTHPEMLREPDTASLRIGKQAGYKRPEPPRPQLKRYKGTRHRCTCGAWIGEPGCAGSRRNLFGRHWCKLCNAGHNAARTESDSALPMLFTQRDSADILQQVQIHLLSGPESTKPVTFYLIKGFKAPKRWTNSGKALPSAIIDVHAIFTLFNPRDVRIVGMLKPAHKQTLLAFGSQPTDGCAQILEAVS